MCYNRCGDIPFLQKPIGFAASYIFALRRTVRRHGKNALRQGLSPGGIIALPNAAKRQAQIKLTYLYSHGVLQILRHKPDHKDIIMKTVILLRHSEPIADRTMPTELIPLSERGYVKAHKFFSLDIFRRVGTVYSSPYKRAYSTAEVLCRHITVDSRLRERELGDPEALSPNFWSRQYEDHNYKNAGGESLNEVKCRMTEAVGEIVSSIKEGGTVAVVSHAAAICALLLNWCTVEVTDEKKKIREIRHGADVVLCGKISTPCAFLLGFDEDLLQSIEYIDSGR